MTTSKFAKVEDIFTDSYQRINRELMDINLKYKLINHDDINEDRFPWFKNLAYTHSYYGSRYWEYPFCIESASLKKGVKCADVGCGSTPFTPYLSQKVGGENVYGFDEFYIEEDSEHSHYNFGTRKSLIDTFGYHFRKCSMTKIDAPDDFFDFVFCISVFEHIPDERIKQQGLLEMKRVLKPGGKLILTFDTGINNPLNNPLNIINYSGLVPAGVLDLKWPEERFVDYKSFSMDVFGLVLDKDGRQVYTDHTQKTKIPMYDAYARYVKIAKDYNVPFSDLLKIKDLEDSFGIVKVGLKKMLKRY